MKINIVAVGKIKESFYREAVAEYSKRLGRFVDFSVVEVAEFPPKTQSEADIRQSVADEGKKILEAAGGVLIAMAIDGQLITSPELAATIQKLTVNGASEISFIIGGSNGLSDEVLSACKKLLSFGRVTYPHQLMRVIMAEQIYRAEAILNRLPYHK